MLSERKKLFWRGLMIISATLLMSCTANAPEDEATGADTRQAALGCDSDSENFSEFMKPGWNQLTNYPNNTQLVIVGSDPQAYRYMVTRNPPTYNTDAEGWPGAVTPVLQAISAERRAMNYYVPFIINGDLTDFGHGHQRRTTRFYFKNYLPGGVGGPLFLPGLGNHDYDGNVDDCGNNGCARDSVCDLITWVQAINPKNAFDYEFVSGNRHRGSMSYSVTVGRVHIIQLNLEPTYTRSFSTGGGLTGKPKRYFDVSSAMNWLNNDLQAAASRGEQIIINLHKRGIGTEGSESWKYPAERLGWFKDMVNQYKVAAIFAGHYHDSIGLVEHLGDVPVFQDGALLAQSYLRLKFDWSYMKLYVEPVVLGQPGKSAVVVDLPYRGRADVMAVTFFEHNNLQGERCTVDIPSGYSHSFNVCGYFGGRASSARIDNFQPGNKLCLYGSNNKRHCYEGNYTGTFHISDLTGAGGLPLWVHRTVEGGTLNDDVQYIRRPPETEWPTYDLKITLYQGENMQGAWCPITLKNGELVPVDYICGPGWQSKVLSARIEGLQQGGSVSLVGTLEDFSLYNSNTFKGDIEIPNLAKAAAPAPGLEIHHSGDVSRKLELINFSRPQGEWEKRALRP